MSTLQSICCFEFEAKALGTVSYMRLFHISCAGEQKDRASLYQHIHIHKGLHVYNIDTTDNDDRSKNSGTSNPKNHS